MFSLLEGHYGACVLVFMLLLDFSSCQAVGEECLAKFKPGKDDFVLDTDESVKDGATFISSPKLGRDKDCVSACCKEPRCNVALMEKGTDESLIKSCFLFDCLYKKKYVCRFVGKAGFRSYITDSVYNQLNEEQPPDESDHPPTANGGQDMVVQPQDTVTLNGMNSKDDIGIVSYQWKMLTEYPYAVFEKISFNDQIIVSNLTSGVYKFQLTVIDTIGQADSTKVTVLVLTPEQSEHHCMVPMKIGPCRGSFPRWHYNAASERCEEFMFGGCKENLNNYITREECKNACYGSEKGGKSGRGVAIPESKEEKCGAPCTREQFTCDNGCCLDPGLECDSTPQCSDKSDEQKCEDLDKKFRTLLDMRVNELKVRCTENLDTGICRHSFTMWYYSPARQRCDRFNYGGCGGNDNKFESEDVCMKVCRGVTEKDVFARQNEADRRMSEGQTGIIAIAALLGFAIFILLCVLVYCLVKGKKKSTQHQRVAVNNVPVSFEDREHLVYNSTTKPI